jgi:sulfur carrier protein
MGGRFLYQSRLPGGSGRFPARGGDLKILFNHPVREVNIPGPKRVQDLLKELDLIPESVLVIRGNDLMTEDDTLRDQDCVEIRPVISGGQGK